MLARVKEFDGDDDKLLAEYQQDIESDQPGEFRQELKDCVADSLRVHLHAERERCVIALRQLSADNTADAWKTANTCEGRRQDETVLLVALEEMRCAKQVLGSEGHST